MRGSRNRQNSHSSLRLASLELASLELARGHGCFVRLAAGVLPALLLAFWILAVPASTYALPWDKDMYSQQSLKAGEIARAPAEGTIPRGFTPFKPKNIVEAEQMLKNPVPFGKDTVWRGRRLWNSNCTACHGIKGNGAGFVGPLIGAPDITGEVYKNKGDGSIFGIVHLGGSKMPVYGNKFSEAEQWDLVNYVRFLQGQAVEGIPRP